MGKKAAVKPAQQMINANLVNKFGAAASSNALDTISFSSIKCHVCARTRPNDCYSNRQILKHRNSVYNPYAPSGRTKEYATCKDCTAAQVTTMLCSICNNQKPIDSFLKTQRNQAKPRCKCCVQYCLDTERHGEAPILDHYVDDSSDESDADPNKNENVNFAVRSNAAEDSDDDVDAPSAAKTNGSRTSTAPQSRTSGAGTPNISRQMSSMNLIDLSDNEGYNPPITQSRVPTNPTSSRAAPALLDTSDNDVNDSDGGGWCTVGVAGKTNSAYRTPTTTWASLVASGNTTPSVAASVSQSVTTRATATRTATTRTTSNTGYTTPATTVSYTSTGRQKWGKPAKLKANDVVDDAWMSKTAMKNKWAPHGGQPKLVKTKGPAHNYEEDEEDEDDEE